MDIELHYGRDSVTLQIPEGNVAAVVRPRQSGSAVHSQQGILKQAIDDDATGFFDVVGGKVLGILLPDGTRDLPLETIGVALLEKCRSAAKILFFICTGTHHADTPENRDIIHCLSTLSEKAGIAYEVIAHDCRQSPLVSLGVTRRATAIQYHERLNEPDCFLTVSDVKHHYFAGYSNPVKYFVPGLCAFETIQQNHSWTMDPRSRAGIHPWHADTQSRDNPLACDQLEAMEKIVAGRPVHALVTISTDGVIQWAAMGPAKTVASRAFEKADAWNSFLVEPVSKMIVSPGGLPNDVDLYIAQRALELTKAAICDHGEILFLSACPNGVGSERTTEQFYHKLICPLDEITVFDRQDYRLFSHKPYRLAHLIKRLDRLWFRSQIESSIIEKMHMTPCLQPQWVVDQWLSKNPDEPILVIDGANKIFLRTTQ